MDRLSAWIDVPLNSASSQNLQGIIASTSDQLGNICNVSLGVETFIERHSTPMGARQIFVDNPDIQSVTSLKYDPMGMFAFSVSALAAGTDYVINPNGKRIDLVMAWPMMYSHPSTMFEVTYQGGVAWATSKTVYNATATYAVTLTTETFTDGRSMQVTGWDSVAGRITFSPLIGCFRNGEDLLMANGTVVTLGACYRASIQNDHPMLERAALLQCGLLWSRRKTIGRTSTDLGNGSSQWSDGYAVHPSVSELLVPYTIHHLRA
jgi:hypothetical protein